METKNYTGTSRPCGEYNKRLLEIVERNLSYFNSNKRKGILTVEHYVDGGDQWEILKDNKVLVCNMNLKELYFAVAGIICYEEVR